MNKYITRIDSNRTHGWWFRVCAKGSEVTHSKFFSDNRYGSDSKALKVAIQYRDKILKNLGLFKRLKYKGKQPEKHYRNKKNTSGIIGVSRITYYKNNNMYELWQAHFNHKGKQHHKSYSIGKYGECEAFKKACFFRFDKEGTLSIYKNKRLPCKLPSDIYQFIDKDKSQKS